MRIVKKILANSNFDKIAIGTPFLLLWGSVMYWGWDEPSFVVFLLFYLLLGNVILKWVIFELIDHFHDNYLGKWLK